MYSYEYTHIVKGESMARISKEKQEEIRKRILIVSRTKFEDVGFEKTSTKEIAKEVGIAEGTLFNYFDSKTEIFFEAFGEEYSNSLSNDILMISEDIVDALFAHFNQNLSMMLKLPRGVISELVIASVRMAKRKPDRFRKLIDLDIAFMKEIEIYLDTLQENKVMHKVNSKYLSEIIYSILGYELIVYVYDKTISKETLMKQLKTKLNIVIDGYKIGGHHD